MAKSPEVLVHILTLNVDALRSVAHQAILNAFAAAKQRGTEPGAILLQEYNFADSGLEILKLELDVKCNSPDQNIWKSVRQFGGGIGAPKSEMDCVVLYNATKYKAEALSNNLIPTATKFILEDEEIGVTPHVGNFKSRWAGVLLTVLNPLTKMPTQAQFVLVSYHGRLNRGKKHAGNIPIEKREHLGPYLVAHLAEKCATRSDDRTPVPVLISGDWNYPLRHLNIESGRKYDTDETIEWKATPKLPAGESPARRNVHDEENSNIDYLVSINYTSGNGMTSSLEITDARFLPHVSNRDDDRKKIFDHDPFVASFTLSPKVLSPPTKGASSSNGYMNSLLIRMTGMRLTPAYT